MNLAEIDKLTSKLANIYDKKKDILIDVNQISIKSISHKYSNTKVPIYRFHINDEVITKNNDYVIDYICLHCDRKITCALNNITRKINKGITKCRTCKELDEHKRHIQSEYMKSSRGKPTEHNIKNNKISILDKIQADIAVFDDMDDDWKDNYYKRHMTCEEFDYIRPKINSIQKGKIKNVNDLQYYPVVSISNQSRFCPYLYNKKNDCIEKIKDIEFVCDSCNDTFMSTDLISHKNKIKCLCRDCNLTNNIFKIRKYRNISDEPILYQSKFELKFIRFCNENKIKLVNGPKISYNWGDKGRTYRVDFFIPKLNLLIEIKDNHIWHKEQVNCGKWQAKLEGVSKYNNIHSSSFIIIFPKNYVKLTKQLSEDYWNK